jgi:hypothetical protein
MDADLLALSRVILEAGGAQPVLTALPDGDWHVQLRCSSPAPFAYRLCSTTDKRRSKKCAAKKAAPT